MEARMMRKKNEAKGRKISLWRGKELVAKGADRQWMDGRQRKVQACVEQLDKQQCNRVTGRRRTTLSPMKA